MINTTDLSVRNKYYRLKNIAHRAHPNYPIIEIYKLLADNRKDALAINFEFLSEEFKGDSRHFRAPIVEEIAYQDFIQDKDSVDISRVRYTDTQDNNTYKYDSIATQSLVRFYDQLKKIAADELEAINNAK